MNGFITQEELGAKIQQAWDDISYKLAMKSEDGRFMMSDVREAFATGTDTILLALGIIDKIGGEYVENHIVRK